MPVLVIPVDPLRRACSIPGDKTIHAAQPQGARPCRTTPTDTEEMDHAIIARFETCRQQGTAPPEIPPEAREADDRARNPQP